MFEILKGSTDVTRYIVLRDSTTGAPETGYTITNLDLQYTRNRTAPATKADAVALAATDSAHADNRAIEVDATSSPGLYRVDWPDAAFATGVDKVLLVVSGTGIDPSYEEIQLVNYNPEDGVRMGLTALPSAAADGAGGLPISDAGGLDLDAKLANTNEVTAARMGALTDWIDGGRLDLLLDAILTDTGTTLDGNISSILTDTNELQTDWTNGGRLDLLIDAIKAVTDLLNAAQSEPTGVPAANATPLTKLGIVYMMLRNRVDVTSTKKTYYDDGGAAEFEKDLSDDGTTYSETEVNAI